MGGGGSDHGDASVRNLQVAFLLNLVFTALEFGGGVWTNSVAILSDAVHDAGDCLSLGLAWLLERLSHGAADARFTYGHRRLSALGALVTGVVLIAGLGFVGTEAIGRLGEREPVRAPGVIALAVLGVLFNGAAAWRLRGGRSLNERVASWHLWEDALGWVAVLLGGAAMAIWDLPIIDPLIALGIALFVLWNVFRNLRRVALVFLQAAPHGFDAAAFARDLAALPGVIGAHHMHTWTLDGESHVFSTHLVLTRGSPRDEVVLVKRRVHEMLREHRFENITVEVELEGECCAAEPEPHA